MMELADMQDLGACAEMRWGSNPHARTKKTRQTVDAFRLSKKSSFCWAFSIFYDIIHMGDENA